MKGVTTLKRALVVLVLAALVGLLLLILAERPASSATTVPAGFSNSTFAKGLAKPTAMSFAPDDRLFVAEKDGKLRVIKGGKLLPTPFVDLSREADQSGERGLLSIAFDPNFASNRFIYVYYTRKATATTPARNRVVRFTASGDKVLSGSGKVVFYLDGLSERLNHNGGAIHFGKDGKLYVATGDNVNSANSQSLSSLHGKVLRINRDGTIPADNPFYTTTSGNNRAIWALGLRNPYSFAVQPTTGRIFANDVGAGAWEEINDTIKGANYGWPLYEGRDNGDSEYADPLYAYSHSGSTVTGCAITGGAFYNPAQPRFPSAYVGDYFFADFCRGWIRRVDYDQATGRFKTVPLFASGLNSPVDLQVGPDGALYYLSIGDFSGNATGSVGKIRYGTS